MTMCIFTGPSLPPNECAGLGLDAVFLPPVAQGDVIRATARGPAAIGIIDGYFERVPAVWHKEILHAMSLGIPVYGSASMGALRAAELHAFGMVGVGAIFNAYRDGQLEDDDEVAVVHGPAELGYPLLSEAMVNIRRTLSDAAAGRVIGQRTRLRLEGLAKALPYGQRSWATVLAAGREDGTSRAEIDELERWLPHGRVDQKREDALLMLRAMAGRPAVAAAPTYHFEATTFWHQAYAGAMGGEAPPP